MAKQPQDEDEDYEPVDLGDDDDLDEDARLKRAADAEQDEIRREILLGQIAAARSALDAAEEAGQTARVAELQRTVAALSSERDRL